MDSIAYVGMDVHKKSHTLCVYFPEDDRIKNRMTIPAEDIELLKYHRSLKKQYPKISKFVFAYEAGYFGYYLYYFLKSYDIECKILSPNTIHNFGNAKVKTDKRDCINIAKTLAFELGKYVYPPSEKDNEVKEYIRMRDCHRRHLTKIKQQINSYLSRLGYKYEGSNWTGKHITYIKKLDLDDNLRVILDEYMTTLFYLRDKIERLDKQIEEISTLDDYKEKVNRLKCLKGIKTYISLSVITEIGDFSRFRNAKQFSSYLGLVPSEASSGGHINRSGITKGGNNHLRSLLVEAAQCHTRGNPAYKSKALKKRQEICAPDVISEADAINERLYKKYIRLSRRGLHRNTIVTAMARQLACDIWFLLKDVD